MSNAHPELLPRSPFADPSRRRFLLRKLHSLTGVVPVGIFLLGHLWTNAKAVEGQQAFDDAVAEINHLLYLPLWELSILVPLAFHALYGIKLALEAKPNTGSYGYTRNWMYFLQRVTGFIALFFIGYHLWEFRVQKLLGSMAPAAFYPTLCAHLSSTLAGVPVVALIYLTGIAASVFHFVNGMWGFCFSWGITISQRAQRYAAVVFGVIGLAIFLLGVNTTLYFATGSHYFLPASWGDDDLGRKPHSCRDLQTPLKSPVSSLMNTRP